MAQCNTKTVPPAEAAPPSAERKNYDRLPVMPPMDNESQKDKITTKMINYRLRLTFSTPDNKDIKQRNKFAALLSLTM
eukprot:12819831-Ditylum_brightwellii.AAC.1